MATAFRVVLIVVELFVALTAIGGGIALVAGLEGQRFPLALLEGTPFRSYVVPGLLLAIVVGGSAAVAAALLFFNPEAGSVASVVAGVVMMGWIVGEVLLLAKPEARSWIEALYFLSGLVMAVLGAVARANGAVAA